MDKKEKEELICREIKEMQALYADLNDKKRALAYKLCEKAAWLKVSIAECQDDINENGYYDKFQQSKGLEPYERTRPVVQTINSFTNNYQKYMKQLAELLPDDPKPEPESDGFEEFMGERDD